ncbi:hypothetical protein DFH87_002651 [Clostridium saccharobutylicum]|uniref:Uncharacterized protein n=1 Tax=Clostridium saccharobutylicum DSM 13864 TaxID=1345695 RepID=U5MTQ3_CLOSA|nr:hypothetical protein CLSA_c18440 [Clostridium saccharobutylicum DSM 13864]MBA8980974.1 hypothetical protein [Clostridium saccharobutylicum]NOV76084.1 hypothetical protein [Clostridium saccharobutylicum]
MGSPKENPVSNVAYDFATQVVIYEIARKYKKKFKFSS